MQIWWIACLKWNLSNAKILLSFENSHSHPVGKLVDERPNGYFVSADNFYLTESIDQYNLLDISASISNLIRLGLIEITDQQICDDDYYVSDKRKKGG